MKYIFLNWKAGVDYASAVSLAALIKGYQTRIIKGNQVIVLPPGVFLLPVFKIFERSSILVGVQDISNFEAGPYTGENTVQMIAPYARFCLIGHSERRRNFHEDGKTINHKITLCQKYGVTPVICVSGEDQLREIVIPQGLEEVFIAYESPEYIGSEAAMDLDQITKFSQLVASLPALSSTKFIYGGSVNESNVSEILDLPEVAGILIGHASLEPNRISQIIPLTSQSL